MMLVFICHSEQSEESLLRFWHEWHQFSRMLWVISNQCEKSPFGVWHELHEFSQKPYVISNPALSVWRRGCEKSKGWMGFLNRCFASHIEMMICLFCHFERSREIFYGLTLMAQTFTNLQCHSEPCPETMTKELREISLGHCPLLIDHWVLPLNPLKNTAAMNTIKKANGREVMMSSFWTAVSTSMSGLALPNRISAKVANKIKMDQMSRCFFWGSGLPLSVNMLNTNTAESTEVTKKLTNNKIVIPLSSPENGYSPKKMKMDENTLPNSFW